MNNQIQQAILDNAKSLLSTAVALANDGRRLHAAHFAATCQEECAKCLMYFDEVGKTFDSRKKQSHVHKGELVGIFYYLAGKLSVIFNIRHIANELMWENKEGLADALLSMSGAIGPKALGALVDEYLLSLDRNPRSDGWRFVNDVRKNSVYCDVVNGQLLAPGQRISEKQLLDVMSTAKLAVGLLDMGINESFSWDRFIEIFPEDMKNPTEEAAEWLAQLKIRLSGHDPSAG